MKSDQNIIGKFSCRRTACARNIYQLTLESVTLGDTDDVYALVHGEHVSDGHLLLEVLAGPVDLKIIGYFT